MTVLGGYGMGRVRGREGWAVGGLVCIWSVFMDVRCKKRNRVWVNGREM